MSVSSVFPERCEILGVASLAPQVSHCRRQQFMMRWYFNDWKVLGRSRNLEKLKFNFVNGIKTKDCGRIFCSSTPVCGERWADRFVLVLRVHLQPPPATSSLYNRSVAELSPVSLLLIIKMNNTGLASSIKPTLVLSLSQTYFSENLPAGNPGHTGPVQALVSRRRAARLRPREMSEDRRGVAHQVLQWPRHVLQ